MNQYKNSRCQPPPVLNCKRKMNNRHYVPDLGKNGELLEVDTRDKKDLFKAISGQLEIVGLSPANDEHLFMMINNNPNIRSVVYYYLKDDDKIELPHHIKKPTTFKKVTKLWYSMK